jgi:hypothetical protein
MRMRFALRRIPAIREVSAIGYRPIIRTSFASGAIAFFLALFCLAGCSDKDKVPSGIIPPDKMQKILWDMIQADQYSDMYLAKDSAGGKAKQETLTLYAQVFQLHKVSREDFQKSFQYYIDRPDLSRSLLDSVVKLGNHDRSASPVTPAAPLPKGASPPTPFRPFAKPGGQIPYSPPGRLPPTAHGFITPRHRADSSAHHSDSSTHRSRILPAHHADSSAHHSHVPPPRTSHPT